MNVTVKHVSVGKCQHDFKMSVSGSVSPCECPLYQCHYAYQCWCVSVSVGVSVSVI